MLFTNKTRWWGLNMVPRSRRRVAVIATYLALIPLMSIAVCDRWAKHPSLAILYAVVMSEFWRRMSVFRLVKSFDRASEQTGKTMRVNGLDEWARYRYGVAKFDLATKEQQKELLDRYRVGTFLVPREASAVQEPDADEIRERGRAEHWALKQLVLFLSLSACQWVIHAEDNRSVEPILVALEFWTFLLLALTLPQARVLWTEEYPQSPGEEGQASQKQTI